MLDIARISSRIVSLTSLPASSLSSSTLAAAFSSTPSISTSSPSAVDGPASAVSGSSSSPSSAPYVPSSSGRASASGCSGGNSGGAVASESLDRRQHCIGSVCERVKYHLMANLVTLGFSARIFRRIFSMTGLLGGSAANCSSWYSLFT